MYNEAGVVIGMAQVLLPFAILPIYASAPERGIRAPRCARIMGAGPWRRFRAITFPLSLPAWRRRRSSSSSRPSATSSIRPCSAAPASSPAMVVESQVVDLLNWVSPRDRMISWP